MRSKLLLGVVATVALALSAATATADPNAVPICSSAGTQLVGTHNGNLTITGNAYVAGGTTLTVTGNLVLAPGSCLDAFSLGVVHVNGSVKVGKGATLGLGCTPGSLGPPFTQPPCLGQTTDDRVNGNLDADQPLTMYIDGVTINGSLTSNGGGPGTAFFLNFPIKDNTVNGNLTLHGWRGGWYGVIRNHVNGNVDIANNAGVANDPSLGTPDPDANEVVDNVINGNLSCHGNVPGAQVGDSGGGPNTVQGSKTGECAGL